MTSEKPKKLEKDESRFAKSSKALKKNLQRRKSVNKINAETTKSEY